MDNLNKNDKVIMKDDERRRSDIQIVTLQNQIKELRDIVNSSSEFNTELRSEVETLNKRLDAHIETDHFDLDSIKEEMESLHKKAEEGVNVAYNNSDTLKEQGNLLKDQSGVLNEVRSILKVKKQVEGAFDLTSTIAGFIKQKMVPIIAVIVAVIGSISYAVKYVLNV